IGSTTKAMTSALAGRLVERGAIAWSTTLAEALPDLAAGMRADYRRITLEQLLAHRGGLLAFNTDADFIRFQAYLQTAR
ncbi:serine hydrolase, partial [Klebsiella aerogenes]|uniref:serine hydrolase n=1 Tax=Klebsiella aerogenes TaxID=548 RepID=UPI0013D358D6